VAQHDPESVAQHTPKWVAQHTPKWVAQHGPKWVAQHGPFYPECGGVPLSNVLLVIEDGLRTEYIWFIYY